MKYSQRDFSLELKKLINDTEQSFYDYTELLRKEYTSKFSKENQRITIEVKRNGQDPFKTDYISFVFIEIQLDKITEIMVEIPIWKTKAYFFGIPLPKNISGNKVIGKLLTLDVAKDAMIEFIEDCLK